MRLAQTFLSFFLKVFFYFLYQPLAWTYDLVSWVVSLGRWKSWVHSVLAEIVGPKVLELGHGTGHLLATLHEKGFRAYGIDRSPQMGKIAFSRLRRSGFEPKLVRGTAEALPFETGSFKDVVATFPTEYILKTETLSSVRRVLHPGGKMILLPAAWITGKRPLDRLAAWLFCATGQAGEWDTRIPDVIRNAGFAVEEKRKKFGDSEVMLVVAKPK